MVVRGSSFVSATSSAREFVERTVDEETPAHLTANVVWKDAAAMQLFESAYGEWRRELREQRLRQWGLQP